MGRRILNLLVLTCRGPVCLLPLSGLCPTLGCMSDSVSCSSQWGAGGSDSKLCCLTCPLFPCPTGIHVFFSINSKSCIWGSREPGARPLSSRDRGPGVGAVKPKRVLKGPVPWLLPPQPHHWGSCLSASLRPQLASAHHSMGWTRSVLPMSSGSSA